MSIEYTYKIISVDEVARCMEVVYTAEGRQLLHVGARLPYTNESLESVIDMYAPVRYWLEQEQPVQVPQVGVSGVITPAKPVTEEVVTPTQASPKGAQPF